MTLALVEQDKVYDQIIRTISWPQVCYSNFSGKRRDRPCHNTYFTKKSQDSPFLLIHGDSMLRHA